MKAFLDTNIFMEYLEERSECLFVERILSSISSKKMKAVISSGTLYTLSYMIERLLKSRGIHRPEQTLQLRKMLNRILCIATVKNLSNKDYVRAINDENFTDIEDAFQYHCAQENGCDVLITINTRDFKRADESKMKIMTPKEFVKSYNI